MSKPPLPARVTSLVRAITADTWNQLLACVEYAMQNPRGDGKTIRNHGEILQAVVPGRQGVSSVPQETYQGDFDIEVIPATEPGFFYVKIFSSSPWGPSRAGYVQNRSGQSYYTLPVYNSPFKLAPKFRYLFYLNVSFDSSDKQRISSVIPELTPKTSGTYLGYVFPVLRFEISEAGKAKVLWRAGYDMPIFVENVQ